METERLTWASRVPALTNVPRKSHRSFFANNTLDLPVVLVQPIDNETGRREKPQWLRKMA